MYQGSEEVSMCGEYSPNFPTYNSGSQEALNPCGSGGEV